MEEGIDFVVCPICNKKLIRITWKHTWFTHELKWAQFRELFPTIQTICEQSSNRTSESGKAAWRDEERKDTLRHRCKENWQEGGIFRSEKYKKAHKDGVAQSIELLSKQGRYGPYSPWIQNLSKHTRKQWEEGKHDWQWPEQRKKQLSNTKKEQWASGIYDCMIGENHYNWKGGISFEPYGEEWTKELREQVRKRDNRKCRLCGLIEKFHKSEYGWSLSVHHIDYNKRNHSIENLITLCIRCHTRTNHNREYWEMHFKEKQKEG